MKAIRIAGLAATALAAALAVATAGLYVAMCQPPERFGAIMSHVPMPAMMVLPFEPLWMRARAGRLQVGDAAPDFTLPTVDESRRVRLAEEYRERPVVLIFGSYTWPPFRREVPALNKLYEAYRDRANFYIIYIQEAHPTDLWQLPSNVRDGVLFASPQTDGERVNVASSCVRKLGIHIPALLDGIENTVERDYTGWPDRIYMIGRDGRVLMKTRPGPFGFSSEELEAALVRYTQR